MNSFLLFIIPAAVWGTTWFVITLQYGSVDALVSVLWRFIGAAIIMFGLCAAKKKSLRFERKAHFRFALMGMFLFSLNYLCFYYSEQFISSALVAVIFSGLSACNAIGSVLILKQRVARRTWFGALMGLAGISVVYGGEIIKLFTNGNIPVLALSISLIGVALASSGNLISQVNGKRGLPLMPSMAWGMAYGSLTTFIVCLIAGSRFTFDFSTQYISSLIYLMVFGTVIAFMTYLKLVSCIGSDKAGYVMVIAPIVAVTTSVLFEGFIPGPYILMGLAFCIIGQVAMLNKKH